MATAEASFGPKSASDTCISLRCFTLRVPTEGNVGVVLADAPVIDPMAKFKAIRHSLIVKEIDSADDDGNIEDGHGLAVGERRCYGIAGSCGYLRDSMPDDQIVF